MFILRASRDEFETVVGVFPTRAVAERAAILFGDDFERAFRGREAEGLDFIGPRGNPLIEGVVLSILDATTGVEDSVE